MWHFAITHILPIIHTLRLRRWRRRWVVAAADLFLEALAEPLFDHALVVQVAVASQSLDAAEHLRIKSQRDGGRLAHIGPVDRVIHEAQIELMSQPKFCLSFLIAPEVGYFVPRRDRFHGF